jgi:hypothetical protein
MMSFIGVVLLLSLRDNGHFLGAQHDDAANDDAKQTKCD